MKHLLLLFLFAASLLFTSCAISTTSRGMTASEARNTYEDAHSTLKHGETTFEQMKEKYGAPTEYKKMEDGFAARWIERHTITQTPGYGNNSLSSFDEGAATGVYHHTMTYVSTLEAYFNQDGTLRSFFVQSDMK